MQASRRWRPWAPRRGRGVLAIMLAVVLLTGSVTAWQLSRSDRAPSFRRGGEFQTGPDAAAPATTPTAAGTQATSEVTTATSGPVRARRAQVSMPITPDAGTAGGDASTADAPAPPAHGTYTYAVAGWEEATGFGRRDYPETMTLVAHGGDGIATDEVVFDLEFSGQHEEREVVAYREDGVFFTFEGGSVTFGPMTQTSEADYEPPMLQIPRPLDAGVRRTGESKAIEADGDVARTERWTVAVVGEETLTIAGRAVATWVVTIDRQTTADSSEQVQRHRTYWYDPGRHLWVRWSEDLHAERDVGPFAFTYDTEFTATLASFVPA